jgi:hypothetical protein
MRNSFKAAVVAGLALGAMSASAAVESYGTQAVPIATFNYASNANGSLVNQGVASYNNLANLGSLTLTITIRDGDTALGNFDFNDLSVGLNGFDTGIKLNTPNTIGNTGFPDNAILQLDVSGAPTQNAAAILASIKAAGGIAKLTIFDNDLDAVNPLLGANAGDVIAFPGGGTLPDAVLQLREGLIQDTGNLVQVAGPENGLEYAQVAAVTAVPLPLAAYLAPLGAGLAGIYSRRFRRQK